MTDSEKTVRALFCAFNKLTAARAALDAWNFFPVADFDTGSNLCRTWKAGVEAIKRDESLSVCELLERAAKSMLRFSKGNAGAILAALCKGFSEAVTLRGRLDSAGLEDAFSRAAARAYTLLPDPVTDGTMLGLVQHCKQQAATCKTCTLPEAWRLLAAATHTYLQPKDPPDPGALGLSLILDGVSEFLSNGVDAVQENNILFSKHGANAGYTYAVSCAVLSKAPVTPDVLLQKLQPLGDAVQVNRRADIFFFSLKTNQPDRVLAATMRFGNLTDISIENCVYQRV